MRSSRRLQLKRERLAELSAGELSRMAGGGYQSGPTCPLDDCRNVSDQAACESILEPCITWGLCTTY